MAVEKWSETVVVARLGSEPQFTDDMDALEQAVSHGKVDAVLDFGGVQFLNSSNLSRLLKLRQIMIQADARLLLCSVSTRLWSTFLITGLDKIFEFSESVTTGLATLQLA